MLLELSSEEGSSILRDLIRQSLISNFVSFSTTISGMVTVDRDISTYLKPLRCRGREFS